MYFTFSTRHFVKVLFLSLLVVLILNYVSAFAFALGFLRGHGYRIFSLFTVDFESSLPTIFNAILILVAFVILLMISLQLWRLKSKQIYTWLLLTCAFLVLSLDENPTVHQIFVSILSHYVSGQRPPVNYAWGMPYGAMVLIFIFFLWRFITTLPGNIRAGFVISGLIYVFGAIVIGLYGADVIEVYSHRDPKYILLASFEESLEMLGLTLFIYYLFEFIQIEFKSFSLRVD